jgi:cell division protease FtsH
MNEVKTPKKPLLFYYGVVLAALLIFNLLIMPLMYNQTVKEVDYGTLMKMTQEKNIGQVEVDDNEIIFTDKDGSSYYKTGTMDDPNLTERLYDSGAVFTRNITKELSPFWSFILSMILPLLLFVGLGQYMAHRLSKGGGKNSMMFGMGKSNAKVCVQSTKGIHFDDVAGEDEAKENLAEIVDYLHNPNKTQKSGLPCRRAYFLSALQVQVKPCWQKRLPVRRTYHSSLLPALNSLRCS